MIVVVVGRYSVRCEQKIDSFMAYNDDVDKGSGADREVGLG